MSDAQQDPLAALEELLKDSKGGADAAGAADAAKVAEEKKVADEQAAKEAKQRAEENMNSHGGSVDYAEVTAELARAIAQLRVIQTSRRKI